MTYLLEPYQLVACSDILSCFQSIYNFGVILLIAFSFLFFVFGAFQYILSAANVYNTNEAKDRMKNSLTALIVGLTFSSLLYYVNPNIFKISLFIPQVKVDLSSLSETELSDEEIREISTYKPTTIKVDVMEPSSEELKDWRLDKIKARDDLENIYIKGDDCHDSECKEGRAEKTEYMNPILRTFLYNLNGSLKTEGLYVKITDGYSPEGDHASESHTKYGTAIDVVVVDSNGQAIDPKDKRWKKVMELATLVGFGVYDERFKKGSKFSSGPHLHLYVDYNVFSKENF